MTLIEINVTQADIDHGQQGHCELCPIARAAVRLLGKPVKVDSMLTIYDDNAALEAEDDDCATIYNLPTAACTFIGAFDEGEKVKPFVFTLGKPLSLPTETW